MDLSVFSSIPSLSFSGFFKPILSFRTAHSFFVSDRVTDLAITTRLVYFVFWKQMSMFTMCFLSVFGLQTISPKTIYLLCYKFKVFWIAARSVVAKMVKLCKFSTISSWYRTFQESVNDSVYSFSPVSIKSLSIPLLVFTASPIPTSSLFIQDDIIKKPAIFSGCKTNFQHFHYYNNTINYEE